ncbi:MAG: nucleoside diphosphate kinase regulator [Rhizobiaceae bacterium]|nr:nucleoside diphosphate kinase regulator [Rhizobiaceae bacterium]
MAIVRFEGRKPPITISLSEKEALEKLADVWALSQPEMADELMAELDRADVVPDTNMRGNVVRMGSTLTYEADTGEARTVTLVYPREADIAEGRISVLTPIGTALIGLSVGHSIEWQTRDGRKQLLTVTSVEQNEPSRAVS